MFLSQDPFRARHGAPASSYNWVQCGNQATDCCTLWEVEHCTSQQKNVFRVKLILLYQLSPFLLIKRRASTCSSVVIPCCKDLPSAMRCACVPPAPPPLCAAAKNGVPQGPKRQKKNAFYILSRNKFGFRFRACRAACSAVCSDKL